MKSEVAMKTRTQVINTFETSRAPLLDTPVWLPLNPNIPYDLNPNNLGKRCKDFEVNIQIFQAGACFKALDGMVFMAPSDFIAIF